MSACVTIYSSHFVDEDKPDGVQQDHREDDRSKCDTGAHHEHEKQYQVNHSSHFFISVVFATPYSAGVMIDSGSSAESKPTGWTQGNNES